VPRGVLTLVDEQDGRPPASHKRPALHGNTLQHHLLLLHHLALFGRPLLHLAAGAQIRRGFCGESRGLGRGLRGTWGASYPEAGAKQREGWE
jgi:hypothetical protein